MKPVGGTAGGYQRIVGQKPVHFQSQRAGTLAVDNPHMLTTSEVCVTEEVSDKGNGFFNGACVQVQFGFGRT